MEQGGLISHLIGGIGNNLFIAVAGWITAKRLDCPHYIFRYTTNEHNHLKHDYTQTILKYLGICLPIEQDEGLALARSCGYTSSSFKNAFEFDTEQFRPNMILEGYFQNASYIIPYESHVREMLLKGIADIRNQLRSEFPNTDWKTAAFIHIRRGDYLKNPHIHPIQPIEYYEKAIQNLGQPTDIFLFSDDMNWTKSQRFFHTLEHTYFIENTDELVCLALMSLCEGGAICGNSSFSWWGAFLGSYACRSPICVPKNYMNAHYVGDFTQIFPADWIQIDA